MFRITEDPSSGRIVQCLAKNYKNNSFVSVDVDMFGFMAAYSNTVKYIHAQRVKIHCHNTDFVHVDGHD
jgi:diacylglycerol kinase family enzyme